MSNFNLQNFTNTGNLELVELINSNKAPKLKHVSGFQGYDFLNITDLLSQDFKKRGCFGAKDDIIWGGRMYKCTFFLDPEQKEKCVEVFKDDVYLENDEWVVTNDNFAKATHIKKRLVVYSVDDSIYTEKTEYELIKNHKGLAKVRVARAIDFLIDTAEQLGASDVVNFIFDSYSAGYNRWKEMADFSLFKKQLEETPETIVDSTTGEIVPNPMFQNTRVEIPNFGPKRFMDAIIEQGTATKWVAPE